MTRIREEEEREEGKGEWQLILFLLRACLSHPCYPWFLFFLSKVIFVVVNSIISSACVVRTNISELVYDRQPLGIIMVALLLLAGSTQSLESEFNPTIAGRVGYVWFARDDEKDDGEVVPRIGRLGTRATKNTFVSELVRERRVTVK